MRWPHDGPANTLSARLPANMGNIATWVAQLVALP
ncbi:hypothetical protein GA0074695_0316 [Micromonospora viridifaciens]|uniref:Uncharacterized protein n=1 Tax=Micromonospora viridifaciens TaxID=1881 RepID=A0A1C4UAV6_MICVI|nr:hypothetical protein GA0074695_0316 [Micromonospora viridifaciens]